MNVRALAGERTSGLAIHLLGTPRVERGGQALPAPRGHKVWGLLAYLICNNAPVSRNHLAGLMFEDAQDPLAALRWNLSELRRLVGDTGLRGDLLVLELEPATWVDVRVVALGAWAQALGVPGLDHELLEGMNFPASPAFEVWLARRKPKRRRDISVRVNLNWNSSIAMIFTKHCRRRCMDLALP